LAPEEVDDTSLVLFIISDCAGKLALGSPTSGFASTINFDEVISSLFGLAAFISSNLVVSCRTFCSVSFIAWVLESEMVLVKIEKRDLKVKMYAP
jgi:hypothetical protein